MATLGTGFELSSPELASGVVPAACTCDGSNQVPTLEWGEPPAGTVGFAVIVDDPDAPRGVFVHWVAWGIPSAVRRVDATTAGQYLQGRNDFGDKGWRGPCPPAGHPPHRYRFQVLALSAHPSLEEGASRQALEAAIRGQVLARAEIGALYGRPGRPEKAARPGR